MPDKHIPSGRIAAKEPTIAIRAAVKLPFFHPHPPLFAPDVRQPGCAPFHLVSFVCQLDYPYPELLNYLRLDYSLHSARQIKTTPQHQVGLVAVKTRKRRVDLPDRLNLCSKSRRRYEAERLN